MNEQSKSPLERARDIIEKVECGMKEVWEKAEDDRRIKLDDVVAYMWTTDTGTHVIDPKEVVVIMKKEQGSGEADR